MCEQLRCRVLRSALWCSRYWLWPAPRGRGVHLCYKSALIVETTTCRKRVKHKGSGQGPRSWVVFLGGSSVRPTTRRSSSAWKRRDFSKVRAEDNFYEFVLRLYLQLQSSWILTRRIWALSNGSKSGLGLWIRRWLIILASTVASLFCDKSKPHFSFKLCSSILGGVKSMHIAVL